MRTFVSSSTAINHEWLMKFVEHRIADRRIVRLIQKWLRAGVLEDGKRTQSEVGTPQGAESHHCWPTSICTTCSTSGPRRGGGTANGDVIIVRYADDCVVGFQHEAEARRFWAELAERFAKFGLELHPEKTRLIEFGRFAAEDRKRNGRGKPETLRLPRLHARLREDAEGAVRGAAADVSQASAAKARGDQGRTEAPPARTRPGGGQVAGSRCFGGTSTTTGCPRTTPHSTPSATPSPGSGGALCAGAARKPG